MAFEDIRDELDEMDVDYEERPARMTGNPEIVIPIDDVPSSQARQIAYLCTSNNGAVLKNSDKWVVTAI